MPVEFDLNIKSWPIHDQELMAVSSGVSALLREHTLMYHLEGRHAMLKEFVNDITDPPSLMVVIRDQNGPGRHRRADNTSLSYSFTG